VRRGRPDQFWRHFRRRPKPRPGEEGFERDHEGFNADGIREDGFKRDKTHAETGTKLDTDGYNFKGFDEEGFTKFGFDKRGKHRDGGYYDKEGFDHNGLTKANFGRDKQYHTPKKTWLYAATRSFTDPVNAGITVWRAISAATIGTGVFVATILGTRAGTSLLDETLNELRGQHAIEAQASQDELAAANRQIALLREMLVVLEGVQNTGAPEIPVEVIPEVKPDTPKTPVVPPEGPDAPVKPPKDAEAPGATVKPPKDSNAVPPAGGPDGKVEEKKKGDSLEGAGDEVEEAEEKTFEKRVKLGGQDGDKKGGAER